MSSEARSSRSRCAPTLTLTLTLSPTLTFGSLVAIKGMFHDEARHELVELLVYTIAMFLLACLTYGVGVPSGT